MQAAEPARRQSPELSTLHSSARPKLRKPAADTSQLRAHLQSRARARPTGRLTEMPRGKRGAKHRRSDARDRLEAHSACGALSGTLKKKLGLSVTSARVDGERSLQDRGLGASCGAQGHVLPAKPMVGPVSAGRHPSVQREAPRTSSKHKKVTKWQGQSSALAQIWPR